MTANKKRILLAFTGLPLAAELFRLASVYTREDEAELDLMRIHVPETQESAEGDGERLYSELRTLSAQLQQRGIRARLRAEPGRGDEPIRNYLKRHSVDLLIVAGHKGGDGQLEDDVDELMHEVLQEVPCTTMMVA